MQEGNNINDIYTRDINRLVTIVIPTLNEEVGIASVIDELNQHGFTNILVVDGYSTDKTVEVARNKGARAVYQHGKGKTGAIRTAIEHTETPFMVIIDGDFTYGAADIKRLIEHMDYYDEIIGARIPVDKKSMTRLHKFGNKVITGMFNSLMNTKLSDVCSGLYLLRTSSARELHLAGSGFDVEAEIAAQIASSGRITEVPINYRPRLGRQKLSTWKHGISITKSIINLARTYNPGVIYSLLSGMLIIPAIIMLINPALEMVFTGKITSPWFFIGISMLLVSIQGMGIGIMTMLLRRNEMRMSRILRGALEKRVLE